VGAKFAGPAEEGHRDPELESVAAALDGSKEVVLYCGCCPMRECTNIRPAYSALKRFGFTTIRVLNIANDLDNDWTTQRLSLRAAPGSAP
jgi:hypothetical protein